MGQALPWALAGAVVLGVAGGIATLCREAKRVAVKANEYRRPWE